MSEDAKRIEARQRANGCNQDDEPEDWGRPCCTEFCVCADQAAGRKSIEDECREAGLIAGVVAQSFFGTLEALLHRPRFSRQVRAAAKKKSPPPKALNKKRAQRIARRITRRHAK